MPLSAMVEAAAPKDEIEGALAVQTACADSRYGVFSRAGRCLHQSSESSLRSAAACLMRALATEVEVLRTAARTRPHLVLDRRASPPDDGVQAIGNANQVNGCTICIGSGMVAPALSTRGDRRRPRSTSACRRSVPGRRGSRIVFARGRPSELTGNVEHAAPPASHADRLATNSMRLWQSRT